MCGRVKLLSYDEVREVVEQVEAQLPFNALPDWPATAASREDAYPGSDLQVIVPKAAQEPVADVPAGLSIVHLNWGFPVDWQSGRVYNTRIESALEGGNMWEGAIQEGRCVVPVACFYERHDSEKAASPTTGRPVKRTYQFSMPAGTPTLLAGVSEGGYVSIVTTRPNATMRPIHRRMPLMLYQDEVGIWLGEDFASLADRDGFALRAEPEPVVFQGQESLF